MDPKDKNANQEEERKAYTPPEVIHEIELETRAGSPVGDELPPGLSNP